MGRKDKSMKTQNIPVRYNMPYFVSFTFILSFKISLFICILTLLSTIDILCLATEGSRVLVL
jgi:hypothetical protein